MEEVLEKVKKHVINNTPTYSYLGSPVRLWKFKIANWLMEDKLTGTVTWFNKLIDILDIEEELEKRFEKEKQSLV